MSMNDFPEPDVQKIPVSVFLENLTVSPENKEWLSGLFLKDTELPPAFIDDISGFIKEIYEKDSNVIMLSFLFDFCVSNPEYFIESKLLSERIKIIPALFAPREDDKPSVFIPFASNILENIRNCAEKDKNFYEAYKKNLKEIRASSSFEERALYYVKLVFQNLPVFNYKKDEKSPVLKKGVSSLKSWADDFNKNMPYSIRLVYELEEISENKPDINYFFQEKQIPEYFILLFPFIVFGKELYTCLYKIICLLINTTSGQILPDNEVMQIKIPRWNEKSYLHEVFFELALKSNNKNISMFILDKIFEGVNAADIPYVFFEFIEECANSIYGLLLKDWCSDVIEPIRAELEYLDWVFTTDTDVPYKVFFDKSRLFLDYIEKLSASAPENKLELFRELFFQRAAYNNLFFDKFQTLGQKNTKDILTSFAQEKIIGEWTFSEQQEKADDLYEEFVDVIAKGAAKYPVKLFFSEDMLTNNSNDHEFIVFKRYCMEILLKNAEEAVIISKLWFNKFHSKQLFSRPVHPSHEYLSELEKKETFFYDNVFSKFINNDDFIFRFLSIIKNICDSQSLISCYLAYWVLYQYKEDKMSDVFNKAAEKLLSEEKIIIPEKTAEFIKSYKIHDELLTVGYNNEAGKFLIYLCVTLSGGLYNNILKNLHGPEEHFPIIYIMYKYSHNNFIQEEFVEFLFNQENPSLFWNKNDFYCLELIQEACKRNVLNKQIVLERVSDYIEKNRKVLFKSQEIKTLITYFFYEKEENKINEAQTAFFTRFCERAVQESEDSYSELYLFLKIRSYFRNKIETILDKYTDINNFLITQCGKILNNFKKNIEQKSFPEDEYTYLNDFILPASDFMWEKTGNIWKALKPLILAFRASKDILLDESLNKKNELSYLFINMITSFFMIKDREKLIELRYNMANDFAEYLKPAKNERHAKKYTQAERKNKGFDLSCTEPSPYWRYAYVRAMGDLGIKTDKRGHYFYKILENVSGKDRSEEVKSAAKKVIKELDSIRNGYSGANHKKCLFEAFWWLKNAHMLSLGGKVDNKKALELRKKEWK